MNITQQVRDWCYAECERQHATTPDDIEGMVRAWQYAAKMSFTGLDLNDLVIMARYIDPTVNSGWRFRTGPAVFMDGGTALDAPSISRNLEVLLKHGTALTPDEFYRELMYIHPWRDGNGRVGAIVYNWLNGTLNNPIDPPEYK